MDVLLKKNQEREYNSTQVLANVSANVCLPIFKMHAALVAVTLVLP